MKKVVDFSVYSTSGRVITQNEWALLRTARGCTGAYAGMWTGNQANPWGRQSLINARAEGYVLGIYTALNGVQDGSWHVEKAVAQCWDLLEDLSFIAIDCELDGITSQQIEQAIGRVRAMHKHPVLYTRKYWWLEQQPKLWSFDHVQLIQAQYDDSPTFKTEPFAGWSTERGNILGKQYSADLELLPGLVFDLNTFKDEWPYV